MSVVGCVFQMENNMMGDKWGTRSRYKEWTNNMKVSELSPAWNDIHVLNWR